MNATTTTPEPRDTQSPAASGPPVAPNGGAPTVAREAIDRHRAAREARRAEAASERTARF